MPVHFTPEQELRLQQLASASNRTADQLVHEAIDSYLNHVESLMAAVRVGEESAERDGWIPHEEVFERLNQRLLKTA